MQHTVSVVVVVGMLFTQVSSVNLAEEAPEVVGTYSCQGTDSTGAPYSGTAVIGKWGDAYFVRWKMGNRTVAIGVGLLTGNSLAVTYYGNTTGVALYTIDDARLVGHWTQPGAHGAVFTETLTRIPHDKLHAPPTPSIDPAPFELSERPA
jgi:hypothetical protein